MMSIIFLMLILGGLFSGLTAGLFGVGGGSFLIPLFLYLLPKLGTSSAHVMHQAVATSLAIIIPSTLAASIEQYKLGHIEMNTLKGWIPPVFVGLCVASFTFHRMSSKSLQIVFIVYLVACAGYMLVHKKNTSGEHIRTISKMAYWIGGVLVGVFSVLLGIGGGTMTTPYFTWYRYPLKKAIAISSVTGVFIGLLGTFSMIIAGSKQSGLAPYSFGYVNLLATFLITPFCLFSAQMGAKIGNKISSKTLNLMYIGFLLTMAFLVLLHVIEPS